MRWLLYAVSLCCICGSLLAGCDDAEYPRRSVLVTGQLVPVIREFQGQQGPFPDRGFRVIQRQDEWRRLWGDRPAPEVDFATHTVLAALMGQRSTSGYTITITSVCITGGTLTVYITEEAPEPDAPVAQVITYPYHMVVIPKTNLPVRVMTTPGSPPFVAITQTFTGTDCGRSEAQGTLVVRDAAAWSACWRPMGEAPKVDFTKDMAVGVWLRARTSPPECRIALVGVSTKDERLEVTYRIARVKEGNPTAAEMPSSPYALAVIPRSDLPVIFIEATRAITPAPTAAHAHASR